MSSKAPAKAPAKKAKKSKSKGPKKPAAPVVAPKRISSGRIAGDYSYGKALKTDKRRAKRLFRQLLNNPKLQIPDFEAFIADGTVLLKALKAVDDKSVTKINEKPNPSQRKDNIKSVVAAVKALNLPQFTYVDFVNGNIDAVLRSLQALEAVAVKAGKFKPVPPKRKKAPAPVASAIGGPLAKGHTFRGKYKFYPAVANPTRAAVVPRQEYLNNIDLTKLPEQFFVRVMSAEELQNSLVSIAFKQGLQKIQKGHRYIIGQRGDSELKSGAFSFLRFLGFKLVPTVESSGGHRVVVDKNKKPFLATLLKYYETASKRYLGVRK
jgi:hypothetical protein